MTDLGGLYFENKFLCLGEGDGLGEGDVGQGFEFAGVFPFDVLQAFFGRQWLHNDYYYYQLKL